MSEAAIMLMRALDFAARRHANQRRKGSGARPYINHLAEVARLLAEATGGADTNLIAAGLLHDTIEDTGTSRAEIEAGFGSDVANLVAEVTDDKSLSKATRKRLQVENTLAKSERARMLKLADKTSNLTDIAADPPDDWPAARRREYVDWALAVTAGCRGVSEYLEARFDEAHEAARISLD